jgi:hypothetical protein
VFFSSPYSGSAHAWLKTKYAFYTTNNDIFQRFYAYFCCKGNFAHLLEKTLTRPNGAPFVKLTFFPEEHYIYVDWEGYLDVDLVKQGSAELLEMILEMKVQKVLISNEKVSGPWGKANQWYATHWNPRARVAGLKYMSVIVSDNIFAQVSLQGFEKVNNGSYTVFTHYDAKVAREWLKNQ